MEQEKVLGLFISTLSYGGAERVVSELIQEISKNTETHLILGKNKINYEIDKEVHVLSTNNEDKKIRPFLNSIIKLIKIKQQMGITHSISFLEKPNLLNVLSQRNEKTIISIRSSKSNFEDSFGYIGKLILKFVYSRANRIVAVSKCIQDEIIKKYKIKPDKINVIYNPVNVEKISALANESLDEYAPLFYLPVLINVGRLSEAKNQKSVLRVFSEIKSCQSNLKLVLIGDGELRDQLLTDVEELGLSSYDVWAGQKFSVKYDVYFLGFQKNPFRFIARSKLFILSSLWEGFPNVLIEAMACGVPVVSADCTSGPREIVAPDSNWTDKVSELEYLQYGLLLPDSKSLDIKEKELLVHEWAMSISKIINDEEILKFYSEKSKQRANDFSVTSIAEEWMRVL